MIHPTIEEISTNIKRYSSPKFIKHKYPDFYKYLYDIYPWIKKITEGMYLFLYHIDRPTCPVCGKYTKFISWSDGYAEFCCRKCQSVGTRQRARQTMTNKYGAPTSFERSDFAEKSKHSMLERYGVEWAQQSESIKEKSAQTCLQKYGDTKPSRTDDVKNKIISTTTERYGGVGMASPIISEKIKSTNLQKYGYETAANSLNVKNKIISTTTERYGGVGMASPIISEKIKSTLNKKYGVNNPAKSGILRGLDTIYISDDLIKYTEDGDWVCKCPHPECNRCQEKQYVTKRQMHYDRTLSGIELCTILNPKNTFTSSLEIFIRGILDKNDIKYEVHNRTLIGQELDIYIPSHKIAIECNGIYWHSTKNNPDIKRHLNKYQLCVKHNIQLITLWEDWIHNTPDIVESLLLSKLGIFNKRIGARQCDIKYVKSCSKFVRDNHIQGPSKSRIHIVLEFQKEIVAAMEFAMRSKTSGGQNENCWELTRFCTRTHWQVIGAASRLLKQFIKDYAPEKIISFSSNDISVGNVYNSLGFVSDLTPTLAYWYITPNMKRYHRTNFMKKKLVQLGEDPTLTEFEIMDNKPIFRVYDSGHIKHTLIPKYI